MAPEHRVSRTRSQSLRRPGTAGSSLLFGCLILTLASVWPGIASAQSIDLAQAAYNAGRFTDAADAGEALGMSAGYALAAQSLTIHAHYFAGDDEKKALLEHAIGLAKKAVHSDSDNADAHLQLARAIGRYAQTVGSLQAASHGYAEQIRESTENALRIDPGMVSAHLGLGRWHAEMVKAMGPFMSRVLYRAREKDAIAAFQRALELAPHAKAVPLEYALGLLALDEKENRAKARDLLMRAIRAPTRDAYEQILHERAVEHLKALEAPVD